MTTVESMLRSWAGNLRNGAYRGRVLKAADEIKLLHRYLGNLLAVIHRDGGHYIDEHGLEKAVADAIELISSSQAENDDLRREVERLKNRLHPAPLTPDPRRLTPERLADMRTAYNAEPRGNEGPLLAHIEALEESERELRDKVDELEVTLDDEEAGQRSEPETINRQSKIIDELRKALDARAAAIVALVNAAPSLLAEMKRREELTKVVAKAGIVLEALHVVHPPTNDDSDVCICQEVRKEIAEAVQAIRCCLEQPQ